MIATIAVLIAQATQPAGGGAPITSAWWWTPLIQGVNFIILALLLWRFLFRRVVQAMDRREKKIASHFEAAELKDKEAAENVAALDAERHELEAQRDGMIRSAVDDAAKQRRELEKQAREIVDRQATQWREDLAREKKAFLAKMQTLAGEQVCAVAAKTLTDMADTDLEGRMAAILCKRLGDLPETDRKTLAEADEPLVVASAFELDAADRKKAADAIGKHIRADAKIEFQTAPELTCGVEIRAGGHKVSWTVDGYLRGIAESLAEAIDEKLRAVAKADPDKQKKKPPKRKRPTRRKSANKSNDDD